MRCKFVTISLTANHYENRSRSKRSMFTINISFNDALQCYENLIREKDKKDPSYTSLRGEFRMFAIRKADRGDHEARDWLTHHDFLFFEDFGIDTSGTETSTQALLSGNNIDQKEELKKSPSYEEPESFPFKPLPASQRKDILDRAEIDTILAPLNKFIGLEGVKTEIRRLADFSQIQKKRHKDGLKGLPEQTYHMIFTGNPGCGKTSVARTLGPIFKQLGITRSDRVIEVDRADLVGEFIGETAQKTRRILERARGGILFIDEAYSLTWSESPRDFGHEAIATILKFMEDVRDDIIVIAAGYTQPMGLFVHSNPGLASRFPIHIEFSDLESDDLAQLFIATCTDHQFSLTDRAQKLLPGIISELQTKNGPDLANGRAIRSLFEQVLRRQSERLMRDGLTSAEDMQLIRADDLGHAPEEVTEATKDIPSNIISLHNRKSKKK